MRTWFCFHNRYIFFTLVFYKHCRYVSEKAGRDISSQFVKLNSIAQKKQKRAVLSLLNNKNVNGEIITEVQKILEDDCFKDLYSALDSKYKLEKFIRCNFDYVPIEPIKIQNEVVGHYLSITQTLTYLFQDKSVSIVKSESTEAGVIQFIRDSETFKNSKCLPQNEDFILLSVYSDVVALTNPLGASKRKHNIWHAYFICHDLPDWEKSSLKMIFNIAYVDNQKIKKDYTVVHNRIVSELKRLETVGIRIGGKKFKFILHTFLGDNLEVHDVSGLQTHFNSGFVCRSCLVTHDQLQDIDKVSTPRTEAHYNMAMAHIQVTNQENTEDSENLQLCTETEDVEEDEDEDEDDYNDRDIYVPNDGPDNEADERKENEEINDDILEASQSMEDETAGSDTFGWKKMCPYNSLMHFSSLRSFPFDLMHDFFEGVLSYDIPSILKYYFKSKQITLDTLNERMKNFNFSQDEGKDKPVLFTTTTLKRLPGKAMANSVLLKILPYLLQPLITHNPSCQIWQSLLMLHRIREIVLAERIDEVLLLELEETIQKFFKVRSQNNVFDLLRPKHHYVYSHLTENIVLHGPPTITWTARYVKKISVTFH